jgi:DNA-directed RNA polymerase subunit RPC12/RpoP
MIDTDHIQIQCPECGHTAFEQPENVQDDDFVKCNECKFEIMLSDLREVGITLRRGLING